MGYYLTAREAKKKAFPRYAVVTNLSQVFIVVSVCVWLIHVKGIEHPNLIIRAILVKTERYNEPDAAALKQPFSLGF